MSRKGSKSLFILRPLVGLSTPQGVKDKRTLAVPVLLCRATVVVYTHNRLQAIIYLEFIRSVSAKEQHPDKTVH